MEENKKITVKKFLDEEFDNVRSKFPELRFHFQYDESTNSGHIDITPNEKDFIEEKLKELVKLYPKSRFRYKHNFLHNIEVTFQEKCDNERVYFYHERDLNNEFKKVFLDDTIMFVSDFEHYDFEDSLLDIKGDQYVD